MLKTEANAKLHEMRIAGLINYWHTHYYLHGSVVPSVAGLITPHVCGHNTHTLTHTTTRFRYVDKVDFNIIIIIVMIFDGDEKLWIIKNSFSHCFSFARHVGASIVRCDFTVKCEENACIHFTRLSPLAIAVSPIQPPRRCRPSLRRHLKMWIVAYTVSAYNLRNIKN